MKSPHPHFWPTILIWFFIAFICIIYLYHQDNPFKIGEINDPQSESARAETILEKKLKYSPSNIIILYKSNSLTTNDQSFKKELNDSLAGLKNIGFDYTLSSPYQHAKQISPDKHSAYAILKIKEPPEEIANYIDEIRAALGQPKSLKLFIGGQPSYIADIYNLSKTNLIRAEIIALPICFIVMVFIFGGIFAALLPIISALISITVILSILYFLGHLFELSIFVLNIATMLGLGLCLDYTLLITQRYREEIAKTDESGSAIQRTLLTAGKSVFFSGLIALISISSLLFFNVNILYSIGLAGAIVIIITVLCSLTFLPAFLCILEKRINSFSITMLKPISTENIHDHKLYRFTMKVMKHPFLVLIPTVLCLMLLGYPFLHVRLSSTTAKILPTWSDSRQLWDQYAKNFDENELTPINIVFTSKDKKILTTRNIGSLYDFAHKVEKNEDVKEISGIIDVDSKLTKTQYQKLYTATPLHLAKDKKDMFDETTRDKYTVMRAVSQYPEEDQRTFDLVKNIREMPAQNGLTKQVGGNTAEVIDAIQNVYMRFFKIILFISLITYVVLVMLLRSVILPLKAILMNFLSLTVCYGMLVFIFQEGNFEKLLHFKSLGYTDFDLPILLFFGLFGLSMDYEVFLLTRVKEFYDKTHDNTKSVALGVERSARVITSAALILIIVSLAFVTADIVFIKAFGLATALAIAVDATLIRLLLVPTTMVLLGKWNWYIPKWLDRVLPKIELEKSK